MTIDGRGGGRVFEGVGAVSAGGSSRLLIDYPEPERGQILDYLFKPGYGAALQILKIEIGGDVDTTDGAEPSHMRTRGEVDCDRGYEWWLAKEAVRRNPDIKLHGLAWGAPGWFDGGFWSADLVDYLITWMDCAKRNGLRVDYLGPGNERGYGRDVYVRLARTLDAHGYRDTKVVASDNHNPPDYWFLSQQLADDPEFAAAVDVLGEHDVCVWRTLQRRCHTSETARGLGKPLWDSENSTQEYDVGTGPLARAMNRHYVDARITGNLNWALTSAWYDNFPIGGTGLLPAERPWSGFYEVGPSIWVDAHTTQFARPGWRYIDGASGYLDGGSSYVTLRSPDTGDYSVVLESMDARAPEKVRFDVGGGLDTGPVRVWSTDVSTKTTDDDFVPAGEVDPVGGTFTVTAEPGHVYTFSTTTGQGKGGARPAADPGAQLPVPYREDFESTGRGRLARYFSDVHGGFEATACAGGRPGTCYRQMVAEQPIVWHAANMPPTTLTGDPRWWGDYEVSADALLEEPGQVELLGRVDSQQHNVAGYHLSVSDDGGWVLYEQDVLNRNRTLASGTAPPPGTGSWHRLGLRFRGDSITAVLDGAELATVADAAHTTGQVGLRVNQWDAAQFDDLRVEPTTAWPRFVPHTRMTAAATSEHGGNDFGHTYLAPRAIDDRLWSSWRSEHPPLAPLPEAITLDLGRTREVGGLAYTPPVAADSAMVTGYDVEVSSDGQDFTKVASGRWQETLATKTATWPEPVRARYVRMAVTDVNGCPRAAAVGELNVSPTPLTGLGHERRPADPAPAFSRLVPQSEITATATSRQPGYEPGRAVDNGCATMWHTSWNPPEPPPQSITLDLGRAYDTSALLYQPRQDGNRNGMITEYAVSTSTDGQNFTGVGGGTWTADDAEKYARWPATPARYVRLAAKAGVGGHASAAELNVAYEP